MSVWIDHHREAERLMAWADEYAAARDRELAAACRLLAAEREAAAFALVPRTKPRTRGILAVSDVSLRRTAGDRDGALRAARGYLADPDLLPGARAMLQALRRNLSR